MKSTLKFMFIACLCAILFITCRKDEPSTNTNSGGNQVELPQKMVSASINGIVIDENGKALKDVSVRLNGESVDSDRNGVFSFRNKNMNAFGTKLEFEKDGFFTIQKLITVQEGKTAFTQIMLMRRLLTASFDAEQGADISTTDGATVNIPANAILDEDGTPYTGTVRAYVKWLDPSDRSVALQMPGDLRAIDEQNELAQLATFGMIGVELVGSAGQYLQLNGSQLANIELPVPNSLLSDAPNTIPLWHFDPATGYWKEEGSASLQGNKYVGEVSHFSFWNCDIPSNFVFIKGKVVNETTGQGVPNEFVTATSVSNPIMIAGTFTDMEGNFSGYIPKGAEITFSVGNLGCGFGLLYELTVGPFDTDPNITVLLTVPENEINVLNFTGQLLKCDGTPVTYGYATISHSGGYGQFMNVDQNGEFDVEFHYCSINAPTSISVSGFDLDTGYETEVQEYPVPAGNNVINGGSLEVCVEQLEEDFYYQIDNGSIIAPFFPYAVLSDSSVLTISGSLGVTVGNPVIIINNPIIGNNTPSLMSLLISNPNLPTACSPCSDIVVNITEIGEVGELVKGSFSGTVEDDGENIPVVGAFEVVREE